MAEIVQTEGIVLRTVTYSETSIILDIFTKHFGLKSFIVSGVRSQKSKAQSFIFRPMNLISFSFYKKENENLNRIKDYHYLYVYENLQINVVRSAVGLFMIECTRNSIKEKEENTPMYDFISKSFMALDKFGNQGLNQFHIHYLIDLSTYLGFYPHNNFSEENIYFDLLNGNFTSHSIDSKYTVDALSSALLSKIIESNHALNITKIENEKIVDYLLMYYALHVENFKKIKSLEVLREIFFD